MRRYRHNFALVRQGFTLIELLIAIAIGSLLVSGISVSLSGWTSAQLRSAARKVNSAFRYAYVTSMTRGTVMRVSFDLKQGTMSIEQSKSPVLIAKADTSRHGSAAQDPWEIAKKRLNEPYQELKEWTDPFSAVSVGGGKAGPIALGGRIHILRVETAARPEASEQQEKEAVYFFQNGINEHAIVQIGDDDKRVYTVEVLPLTGRTKFYNHAYEPDEFHDASFMEVRE